MSEVLELVSGKTGCEPRPSGFRVLAPVVASGDWRGPELFTGSIWEREEDRAQKEAEPQFQTIREETPLDKRPWRKIQGQGWGRAVSLVSQHHPRSPGLAPDTTCI